MFNSIRIRLTIWYLAVLALIIVGFAIAVFILVERNLDQTINKNIGDIQQSVAAELTKEAGDFQNKREHLQKGGVEDEENAEAPNTIESVISEEIGDMRFLEFSIAVFDQNDKIVGSTVFDPKLKSNLSLRTEPGDIVVDGSTFRVARQTMQLGGKTFHLFVSSSLDRQIEFLAKLRNIFLFTIPIALLFAGLFGYFLARRSLAPVVLMSTQAANIGSTNLNARLAVKNEKDELGNLAKVFNLLLTRLENSFVQQKRFMADASHELRTPLAIVRAESEIAISDSKREAGDYRESLAIIHDESKRLTTIVDDLLLLARADSGQFQPELEPVSLGEILTDSVRAVRALAEKRQVELHFSEFPEMPIFADKALLHRLFLNLLDNAIKYNREHGSVLIEPFPGAGMYQIKITDKGEGIAAENQAKIFERFYRVDEARSRDEHHQAGGAGLGLSIARWIAGTHNGNVKLVESTANGTTFQIELPIQNFPHETV